MRADEAYALTGLEGGDRHLRHRWMLGKHGFDFCGAHAVAQRVDGVVAATAIMQTALAIEANDVARQEPVATIRVPCRLRVVEVLQHQARIAMVNGENAFLSLGQGLVATFHRKDGDTPARLRAAW